MSDWADWQTVRSILGLLGKPASPVFNAFRLATGCTSVSRHRPLGVVFSGLFAMCFAALLFAAAPAHADEWTSVHTSLRYDSPDSACRAQWAYYMSGHPGSKYVGAFEKPGHPDYFNCQWTTYRKGCTGGINTCGTILPGASTLVCPSGYSDETGVCQKDPIPECPPCRNGGSSINPQVGKPIVLSTGAKIRAETDYETADREFSIGRRYRSLPGRSVSFQTPLSGLTGGWAFDFAYELQLQVFSGSPSSPNAKLALVRPDGTTSDFLMQGGGTIVPDTTTGAYYAARNVAVELIGAPPADLSTLQNTSSQWRVTDDDDVVWVFQTFLRPNTTTPYAVGRPISRVARDGYRWDFTYRSDGSLERITDSFGRQATFSWATFFMTGQTSPVMPFLPWPEAIASITLPDGTSLRYTYDPPPVTSAPSPTRVQRLIRVERLNSLGTPVRTTRYVYEDSRFPRFLTGVLDHDGSRIATYSYDEHGLALSTAGAGGTDSFSVAYSETSTDRVRSVVYPLGKGVTYEFKKIAGNPRDVRISRKIQQSSPNSPAATETYTYGTDNFIASITDEEGRVTSFVRDSRGRPSTIVEAYGTPEARTTSIGWHSALNLHTSIARTGISETRTYDSQGRLLSITQTDTTSHSLPYATNGQTRTWTYSWGATGRLLSINGPKPVDGAGKDDTLTFTYDAAGNLITSTNGLGQTTSFAGHDANGRPATMTDANSVVTSFAYDVLGRTTAITLKHPTNTSLDATTTIAYDSHDRIAAISLPATDVLYMDYDAADRLIAMRAASGERIDYTVDQQGNIVSEKVSRTDTTFARTIARTFDDLGRMLSETLGPGRTSNWGYDKVDNVTAFTTPRGNAIQQAFDPLNRLVSTVSPDAGEELLAYDAADDVTSYTDPASVQTVFVRNGFGDVIREVSPDRGTTDYYYDAAGDMTASIDGRGQRVDYTRDILGRIIEKVPQGVSAQAITYTWDTAGIAGSYGVGRLATVTDATGTTSFAYDHRGNLITKRQTVGGGSADLGFTYDLADRITQIAYPSGRLVAYDRDTKGRVSTIRTKASASDPSWTGLASAMTYEPWGSLKGADLGNGLHLTQNWGNDGRLAAKSLTNPSTSQTLSSLSYTYDANDNPTAVNDNVDATRNMTYAYDSVDRLTQSVAASGSIRRTDFLFDKNGNRTSVELRADPADVSPVATDTYTRVSGKNQLASVVNAAGTRSITYDGRGNTLSETRPGAVTVAATYDGYGRLLTYARTGDPTQTNAYNGLDDRVSATSGSVTRRFVYDLDGRVIGEYGASASDVIAETIWMSPEVANDNAPLGGDDGVGGYAPLAVVTGSGTGAALSWVQGNHLGVPLLYTDGSGAAVTPASYSVPGFPGQMKTLSDLYYNRYRDYESSTGRYIQADPIGLRGGANPYVYANDNPLRWTDPDGKNPILGAIIGGGGNLLWQLYKNDGRFECVNPWEVADWALFGATLGEGYAWFKVGREIKIGKNWRIAPFGNRTGDKYGEWPHYHRRGPAGADGQTPPGQGIGRHRPFEPSRHDRSIWDRF